MSELTCGGEPAFSRYDAARFPSRNSATYWYALIRYRRLRVVLLQLSIERSLADSQEPGGPEFVATRFAEGTQNRAPFQFFERQKFVFVWQRRRHVVLEIRRQVADMQDGP